MNMPARRRQLLPGGSPVTGSYLTARAGRDPAREGPAPTRQTPPGFLAYPGGLRSRALPSHGRCSVGAHQTGTSQPTHQQSVEATSARERWPKFRPTGGRATAADIADSGRSQRPSAPRGGGGDSPAKPEPAGQYPYARNVGTPRTSRLQDHDREETALIA